MDDPTLFTTAETLSRALPYMQRYDGSVVVIKLGGHAMGSDSAMNSFARDVVLMQQVGVNPVVVHGGGPMIDTMLERLDISSSFVNGKRVTDQAAIEVVEMVLSGTLNKRIVHAICLQGGNAVGISGKDGGLLTCAPLDPELGLVGRPDAIDTTIVDGLFSIGAIPVIAPIGVGKDSQTYNINADTVAGAISSALGADRLLLLTDVEGVKDRDGNLIPELTPSQIHTMIEEKTIVGGMIPKTETALAAVEAGVRAVAILDGRTPHACLLELYSDNGAGSLIQSETLREQRYSNAP